VLPIKDLANQKIAYLKMGDATNIHFFYIKKKYTEVTER
jgi:endo-alpha-1,4-polygalactosaminidase (GH114 family)